MRWNRVVTIDKYYDGPRQGVAFLDESLAVYECIFSRELNDYLDEYDVSIVDSSLLPLIEERWAIYKRWHHAYRSGQIDTDMSDNDTRVLPEDRNRYDELTAILDPKLRIDHESCERYIATFSTDQSEVTWKKASDK